MDRFRDGVWLCELAPLVDGVAVGHAIAAALRLQQRQGLDIESTVIEYLGMRELLLVMDNCEHVLDAAARMIDQIVMHCPRVTVLATSREALGIEGERILAVPALAQDDATALFADRAKAGRPDFDLDREPGEGGGRSADSSTDCRSQSSWRRR
jgi:predicted ATPase